MFGANDAQRMKLDGVVYGASTSNGRRNIAGGLPP